MIGFGRRTTPEPFVNACHTFVYLENLGVQAIGEARRAAGAEQAEQGDQAEPGGGECGLPRVTALAGTPAEIAKLTVPKLKAELKDRGLDDTGLKKVLVERLTAALAAPAAPPSPAMAAAPAELEGTKLEGRLKNLDVQLREAINTCLAEHHADDAGPEGWVDISLLTPVLRRRAPDWDVRNYGVNKSAGLSGLLKLPELSELFELNAQPQEAADRDSKQVLLTVVYSVRVKPGVTCVSP